jgi:hypothetical protein
MMTRQKRAKNQIGLNPELAAEAKAIVALGFRNGPIADLHAGKYCPTCSQDASYSRISEAEMKLIMKNAVDQVYSLLWMKQNKPIAYAASLEFGRLYSKAWDDPVLKVQTGQG